VLPEITALDYYFQLPCLNPDKVHLYEKYRIWSFTERQSQLLALLAMHFFDFMDGITQGYRPEAVVCSKGYISMLVIWDPSHPGTTGIPQIRGNPLPANGSHHWLHSRLDEGVFEEFSSLMGSFNMIVYSLTSQPLWIPFQGASGEVQNWSWWESEAANGSHQPISTAFSRNKLPKSVEAIIFLVPRRVVHLIWRGDYEPQSFSVKGRVLHSSMRKWARGVIKT